MMDECPSRTSRAANNRKSLLHNNTGPMSAAAMATRQADLTTRINTIIRYLEYGVIYTAV